MKKYKKKPIIIEAIIFDGSGEMPEVELSMLDSDADWICSNCGQVARKHGNVKTFEGFHIACPGDYIIRGIKNEHYPCKPNRFKATYEECDKAIEKIGFYFVDLSVLNQFKR